MRLAIPDQAWGNPQGRGVDRASRWGRCNGGGDAMSTAPTRRRMGPVEGCGHEGWVSSMPPRGSTSSPTRRRRRPCCSYPRRGHDHTCKHDGHPGGQPSPNHHAKGGDRRMTERRPHDGPRRQKNGRGTTRSPGARGKPSMGNGV